MTILNSNGIAFAFIENDDDFENVEQHDMATYTYRQWRMPSGVCNEYTIACYTREDFLELLAHWNDVSPNLFQYFEKN